MNTCACCGQSLKFNGRPIVKVDDALLALCNEAYANAKARSAADVLIADLVLRVAQSFRWSVDIEALGATPDHLARSATLALQRTTRRAASPGVLATSEDLKTLLARAEVRAHHAGRPAADTRDLLHVLFRQAQDLAGADFMRAGTDAAFALPPGGRSGEEVSPFRSNADRHSPFDGFLSARGPADVAPQETFSSSIAEAGGTVRPNGWAALEHQNAELRRAHDALADQVRLLSSRISRLTAFESQAQVERKDMTAWLDDRLNERLAMQTRPDAALRRDWGDLSHRLGEQARHIEKLQKIVDALAHQSATAISRFSQASDHLERQGAMIADLQGRLRDGETEQAIRRRRQGAGRGSQRSRLRRSRRRSLRLRLRERRRARTYSRRHRRSGEWARRTRGTKPYAPGGETHAPPLVTDLALDAQRFVTPACPLAEHGPAIVASEPVQSADFEDEIAEPIEEEEEFEPVGAFGERPKRFYLALDDDVERAPSIGPRTAARLAAAGVATVRDLLLCDARQVASQVQSRYVSAERLTAWKSQARLVCVVPWLRGTHAQLLVGAGYDTLDKLQRANASDVCAGILRFAATREGQSVLRSGPPPAPERVAAWMGHMMLAEPERARLVA